MLSCLSPEQEAVLSGWVSFPKLEGVALVGHAEQVTQLSFSEGANGKTRPGSVNRPLLFFGVSPRAVLHTGIKRDIRSVIPKVDKVISA
jgi:hypothetical protein